MRYVHSILYTSLFWMLGFCLLTGYGLYSGVEIRWPAATTEAQQALDIFDVADNATAPVRPAHHKRTR